MRSWPTLVLLLFASACATPAYIVGTADDRIRSVAAAAEELSGADVIALGEEHGSAPVHETHHALLRQLHARRPNIVIAMEMFERDVQSDVLLYLTGQVDEATFLGKSRPWDGYATDYRPVIEFAKQHSLVVLAANAPRPLATKASKLGAEAVVGDPHVARSTSAPEDEYWDAFQATMGDHAGTAGPAAMQRFYAAQCLKDDTMAETVVDYLQKNSSSGDRPLVVLIAGKFHTDHRRGTVARIASRMPSLDIRVLSVESVVDVSSHVYTVPRSVGDYVVVAPKQPAKAVRLPRPAAGAAAAAPGQPAASEAVVAVAAPVAAPEQNPPGVRPALGLMPDYASQVEGVAVQAVREGGPAAEAGIEVGDVIMELAGKPVNSVEVYTALLDEQIIGRLVPVRVRRGEAEVLLQVRVTSRSR